ncbi:MAG: translocation/assembly module TamB domain-containing protein [Prevotella sp.]|nr:translocation/assembly module TamB domain-containing protein [Prevotella sp.]
MRKTFLWIGGLLLSPFLLFTILCVLLYLPPVQNWVVDKVAEVASEKTGLQITVDHVDLDFPLNLGIDGVLVVKPESDTIANIGRAVAHVELLPLLESRVVVNKLELNDAQINTYDFISDLQVRGHVGHLYVQSRGIDLTEGTVELNGAQIADADVTILLSDTAAVDTTTSETPWLIRADSLSILRSRVEVHLPGDSMLVSALMGSLKVQEGVIDLLHGLYTVRSADWHEGALTYDLPYEPKAAAGIDYNHLALSSIDIGLDSIHFSSPNLAVRIRNAALREQSGLAISQLQGNVLMDSVGIRLPNLLLSTPYSNIRAKAEVDFSVMDSVSPGQLHANLKASLGKPDLMLFLADMPERFRQRWPEWPLSISGQIDGNMQQARIGQMEIDLPTALHAKLDGQVSVAGLLSPTTSHLSPLTSHLSSLHLQAETYDLGFATALLDPQTMKGLRIPSGIKMGGSVSAGNGRYTANLTARQGKGSVALKGFFDERTMAYDANVDIHQLNLHAFMPKDSLGLITARVQAKGQGFDFLKQGTRLRAEADIRQLQYGRLNLDSIYCTAQLNGGRLQADLSGCNQLFEGLASVNATISSTGRGATATQQIDGTADLDLHKLDLYRLGLAADPLAIGGNGRVQIGSNLKQEHWARALLNELYLRDEKQNFHPEDFGLYVRTQPDSTWARIQSGNLIVKMDASGGYEQLLKQLTTLADTAMAQIENKVIDQVAIKRLLPNMRLQLTSGRENPIAAILRASNNIDFKDMAANLTTSPTSGINGEAHLFGLNADSTRIDTVLMTLKDTDHGLTFQGRVANNRRNPQMVFKALVDGNIHQHGANVGVRFYDERGNMGLRIGARADMVADGINLHLLPERPTIGYKEFNLNKDNFLLIGHQDKLQAKIDLIADDGTGVKIYSENQDSLMLQDLTVSLYRFDLEKTTSVLPYVLPRIGGMLDGDFHLMMNQQKQISVVSDMQVSNLIYEQNPIGNLSTEFVYLQREDDTHAIDGRMMLEEKEICTLKGEYRNERAGYLNADLVLEHTPMMIVNGLVPDQLLGLEGYAEGEVKVKGPLNRPDVDGEVYLEDAYLISKPYGVRLRFDNDPVRIIDSKLLLENFTMYAYNDNPLNIMGDIDFHDTDRITLDLRMRAQNFQLVNSKQTKESVAYGKAFINFFARMQGRLDQLKMTGRLNVLGTTDLTYLLLDSPLSTDNQMDELVKFTDFSDSTQTVVQKPTPQGLDMNLNISIDPGVHVLCGLNVDQSNYVDLFGGGDLRMRYSDDGISLTGRYTIESGEMKYSLPVIPLKTFTLQDGSYVEFTGDPMNPRLNLTATERTKASVAEEGQPSRSVAFDCGVVITKTLNDMGLQFIISAPEDMSVQSELNAMNAEQQGKLAVTMLTTGMYLADGNTSGFSMNSALSSFLQSEINNITGNALKTLDLSIGLDNTTDASGTMHTDYSFKFAKRFWNNRLKVQIGGKVSTGSEAQAGEKQSFFDNVTMEYRLSPTSNQYVKLFYNQNVYDWLEGYTSEYGGGYIWKRKLDKFWDILKIWGNEKRNVPQQPRDRPSKDSINNEQTIKTQ